MKKVGLLATGSYAPEKKLTNRDLEKMVDTTDEWITSRTGIKERRIAGDEWTSDMAVKAARNCLEKLDVRPDLLISSTATPEKRCPYQASIVANRLNLTNLGAFDLNAACSGLIYGLTVAKNMMQVGDSYRHILVTASEKMTMFTDYTDRASCVLFGDGASALMLSTEQPEHEILATELGLDATGSDYVVMGGEGEDFYFRQDGRKVFKFAVTILSKLIDQLAFKSGATKNDDFYIIPHQANYRMLESVAREKGIPMERFICNIDRYGNTSSASIGLALHEAAEAGRFKKGDLILLIGFGGGLSWAGAAIRW